jgi:hypothetical protein
MDNRPKGVSHTAPPLTRAAVILELIDRVLADCEPNSASYGAPPRT